MENTYGDGGSSMRAPKLKSLAGKVSTLSLNSQNFIGRGFCHRHHHLYSPKTPIFDPYASSDSCSDSSNQDSPLIRYLSSSFGGCAGGSDRGVGGGFLSSLPLSSIDNFDMRPSRSLPVSAAPIEEGMIVMDAIAVDSSNSPAKSSGGARMKNSLTSLDTDGRLQPSLSSSFTVGKENNSYMTEKCRSKEEFSSCRFGSKCQLTRGKEELRPSRFFSEAKLEAQPCKLYSAGACAYGSKCRFLHNHQVNEAAPSMEASNASKSLPAVTKTVSPIKHDYSDTDSTFAHSDWCPLNDGIEVTGISASSEKATSEEDVNGHINAVLYGPCVKTRLPVFIEICPE